MALALKHCLDFKKGVILRRPNVRLAKLSSNISSEIPIVMAAFVIDHFYQCFQLRKRETGKCIYLCDLWCDSLVLKSDDCMAC